ncbi:MAG TPA: GNAT family N-acetyltransferase [Actinomycetota bacterium]
MPVPDHIHRFWRALDELFASVRPTTWGAVVTDGRYPRIWDTNYARIDVADPRLRVADIDADLLPALAAAGATTYHVVSFRPEATAGLLAELSSRGDRLSWDLVMEVGPGDPVRATTDDRVEEVPAGDELWRRVGDSLALFGVEPGDAVHQLRAIERDVLEPGGKRWFAIREEGEIVSLAALVLLEGVGYVDNVATFPASRGKGYASALTTRIVREARSRGAEHVCLFADPDDDAVVRLYGSLGFRDVGRLASTRGPVDRAPRGDRPHATNL